MTRFAIAFLLAASQAWAADVPVVSVQVKVTRVSDADTFEGRMTANCVQGFNCDFTFRLFDIDSPETRRGKGTGYARCEKEKRLGLIAKAQAVKLLKDQIVTVTVVDTGPDPRGRKIVSTTLPDGRDYGDVMLKAGLVVPYDPTKAGNYTKPRWCD